MCKRDRGVEIKRTEELFNLLESNVISQWPYEKNE